MSIYEAQWSLNHPTLPLPGCGHLCSAHPHSMCPQPVLHSEVCSATKVTTRASEGLCYGNLSFSLSNRPRCNNNNDSNLGMFPKVEKVKVLFGVICGFRYLLRIQEGVLCRWGGRPSTSQKSVLCNLGRVISSPLFLCAFNYNISKISVASMSWVSPFSFHRHQDHQPLLTVPC